MIVQAETLEWLVNGKDLTLYYESGEWPKINESYDVIYSGSFNPLHVGHLEITHYLETKLNLKVLHEICISRFDKPELALDEIYTIKSQFDGLNRPTLFTRFATFLSKSRLKLGIKFAVGADTILRINDTKYYFGSMDERNRVFQKFKDRRVSFFVFPRQGYSLDDIVSRGGGSDPAIHPKLKELCTFIDFTPTDISSTKLRG